MHTLAFIPHCRIIEIDPPTPENLARRFMFFNFNFPSSILENFNSCCMFTLRRIMSWSAFITRTMKITRWHKTQLSRGERSVNEKSKLHLSRKGIYARKEKSEELGRRFM